MPCFMKRREKFRAILEGSDCVRPASVHDPISARIAEDLGFDLGMFAGSVASLTVLGAPDLILLTLSEFADQAYRISRASELPVLADADHGYGNALNVMRTVEELETAGVAGLSIEDTELPQTYGSGGKPALVSVEEGAAKVSAALGARSDPGLVIAGRTSAAAFAGIDEAILRAKAYEAAGADAIFLVGVRTRGDLEAAAAQIKLPLILGGAGPDLDDAAYLAGRNVRVCLQGHQPFAAAVQAVYATMKALKDGTPPKELPNLASSDLMAAASRDGDYRDWIKRYLA
ncbi:MAG: isocitrate lyase/PEP mutase family protein [Kiloniellales bacterium]|nr:isocitrate lyase/PEP mutase family protein [Kiloniellales bacterium]